MVDWHRPAKSVIRIAQAISDRFGFNLDDAIATMIEHLWELAQECEQALTWTQAVFFLTRLGDGNHSRNLCQPPCGVRHQLQINQRSLHGFVAQPPAQVIDWHPVEQQMTGIGVAESVGPNPFSLGQTTEGGGPLRGGLDPTPGRRPADGEYAPFPNVGEVHDSAQGVLQLGVYRYDAAAPSFPFPSRTRIVGWSESSERSATSKARASETRSPARH